MRYAPCTRRGVSLQPAPDIDPAALARSVVAKIGRPVDAWAVVATLEGEGWRDVDAGPAAGCEDLFELGDVVYAHTHGVEPPVAESVVNRPSRARIAGRFTLSYGKGLLYALPVMGQVTALVWLGYSLWASSSLTEGPATMIALSTVGSFLVTGGLIQAMARETMRLLGAELEDQARRVGLRFAAFGVALVLAVGLGVAILNVLVPFYPADLALIGLVYFVLLGILWVTVALLYVQERLFAVGVATFSGILPVVLAIEVLGWSIYVAQALGLVVAIGVAAAWAWCTLGRGGEPVEGPQPPLPRLSTVVHTTLPFAAYGTLYFSFLFADRVVAWTAAGDEPLPYVVWFRTPYELGMDWALVVLFACLALFPFAVGRLVRGLHAAQDAPIGQASEAFLAEYGMHARLTVGVGLGALALAYGGGVWLRESGPALLAPMFDGAVPTYVFIVAGLAYVMLSVGLFNGLVFLAQGRMRHVLVPLALGLGTDLVVGIVLTRLTSYEHAVWGLAAGAAVYAFLTTRSVLTLARQADYHAYAAY